MTIRYGIMVNRTTYCVFIVLTCATAVSPIVLTYAISVSLRVSVIAVWLYRTSTPRPKVRMHGTWSPSYCKPTPANVSAT